MAATEDISKSDILTMARKLPLEQRWELIRDLGETITPPPPDGMTRKEFLAELDRRGKNVNPGEWPARQWTK